MYAWRKMSDRGRRELLAARKRQGHPWHSPPHWNNARTERYLFTAACFEHQPFIGHSLERMAAFEDALLTVTKTECTALFAWVVLPNHYHFLAQTTDAPGVLTASARSTGAPRSSGTAKKMPEVAKSGAAPPRPHSSPSAISGPRSTTSTTTRSNTAGWTAGRTGLSPAPLSIWKIPSGKKPSESGANTRSMTMDAAGTIDPVGVRPLGCRKGGDLSATSLRLRFSSNSLKAGHQRQAFVHAEDRPSKPIPFA